MRKNLRYGLLIMLMMAIVFPLLLSAWSNIYQAWIQHEMLEKLERSSLHTISLEPHEVIWHKKNKEIVINHKMFDVKSWKEVNGKIIFLGLYDEEETELFKLVVKQTQENQKKKNTGKFYQHQWINEELPSLFLLPKVYLSHSDFLEYTYKENFHKTDIPPPRLHIDFPVI
jgi:hypothetical protein